MSTYKLTVSTPDGNVFDGEVSALFVRGAAGDLAVLAGHVPFVTTVQAGKAEIELEDGTRLVGTTDGGILTVGKESTTLLSGTIKFD